MFGTQKSCIQCNTLILLELQSVCADTFLCEDQYLNIVTLQSQTIF